VFSFKPLYQIRIFGIAGYDLVGAALTIGLFGTIGIVFRRGLFGAIDPGGKRLTVLITAFEIGSSLVILALELAFFIGSPSW
jgi:hypothetical protein